MNIHFHTRELEIGLDIAPFEWGFGLIQNWEMVVLSLGPFHFYSAILEPFGKPLKGA